MNFDLGEVGEVDMDFDRDGFSSSSEVSDVEEAEVIAYGGKISWKDVTGLSEILIGGRSPSSYLQDSPLVPSELNTGVNFPYDSPGADWYKVPWRSLNVYRSVSASYAMRLKPSGRRQASSSYCVQRLIDVITTCVIFKALVVFKNTEIRCSRG